MSCLTAVNVAWDIGNDPTGLPFPAFVTPGTGTAVLLSNVAVEVSCEVLYSLQTHLCSIRPSGIVHVSSRLPQAGVPCAQWGRRVFAERGMHPKPEPRVGLPCIAAGPRHCSVL